VTRALIALAVVQFGIYLVSAVTTEVRNVAQQCLQERISQVVQLQVMEQACKLDMAFFEDSRSYDLLRQTQQEAAARPLQMGQRGARIASGRHHVDQHAGRAHRTEPVAGAGGAGSGSPGVHL
jgi:ABC-type multidrug transport system fused ATPase/permease subunit